MDTYRENFNKALRMYENGISLIQIGKELGINRKRLSKDFKKLGIEIIQNNQKLGIPTGPNVDGSENLINAYTYNIIKCMVHALQNDASIQCAIPMNSLLIQAIGANGGGSVTCIGSNLKDSISQGIIH